MDKYPKYISEERQELFERYLLGQMNAAEKESFETNIGEDAGLQDEFEEFNALFQTIEESGMRTKLNEFHQNIEKDNIPVRQLDPPKRKFNFRIAATVLLLLSVGGFWFFNRADPNERLFHEYYTQDPGLPTVMGSNDNYEFYEAMVDYKQGNYAIAIEKWGKLLEKKPENDTLNYFMGSAYLANDNALRSLRYLEQVSNDKSSKFRDDALYYLALGYLKVNRKDAAEKTLKQAESARVIELMEELDKSK